MASGASATSPPATSASAREVIVNPANVDLWQLLFHYHWNWVAVLLMLLIASVTVGTIARR
jgi:hypothetical protein